MDHATAHGAPKQVFGGAPIAPGIGGAADRRAGEKLRGRPGNRAVHLRKWPRAASWHIVGPELGADTAGARPWFCGDSHNQHGTAPSAPLAFGIGTTEVAHVLATPVPAATAGRRPMAIEVGGGPWAPGVYRQGT